MSAIAEELSRRTSAGYLKAKARERTVEMRDRFIQSPVALGMIGGAVGAVAGKLISDQIRKSRGDGRARYGWQERYLAEEIPYDEYTATHPRERIITEDRMYGLDQHLGEGVPEGAEGIRERAGEKAGELKERAEELTGRAKEKAGELRGRAKEAISGAREHMPSSVGEGAHALRESTSEYAGLWGIGAMIAGAFFGAMVPVTRRERQMLAPAKEEVKEQLRSLKQEAADRVHQVKEAVEANVGLVSGAKKPAEAKPAEVTPAEPVSATPAEEEPRVEAEAWHPPFEPEPTRH